jgi:predicted esterase
MRKIAKKRVVKPLIFTSAGMIILTVVSLLANPCSNKWEDGSIYLEESLTGIEIIDRYSSADGYYVFLPEKKEESREIKSVVGFVHGYGALNPKIFGAWLKHLVQNGNAVIYPRYQYNLLLPSSDEFTANTGTALKDALSLLEESKRLDNDFKFNLAGHSFGGVICANLLIDYKLYDLPKPSGALIAEGGTGPLTGAMKESYSDIESDIPLIIAVGSRDFTVGDHFGKKLSSEIKSHLAVYVYQKPFVNDSIEIGAAHYDPYSLDDWCDNGMDNITSNRAEHVSKYDVLDRHGYWKWLDAIIAESLLPDGHASKPSISEETFFLNGLETEVLEVTFLGTP